MSLRDTGGTGGIQGVSWEEDINRHYRAMRSVSWQNSTRRSSWTGIIVGKILMFRQKFEISVEDPVYEGAWCYSRREDEFQLSDGTGTAPCVSPECEGLEREREGWPWPSRFSDEILGNCSDTDARFRAIDTSVSENIEISSDLGQSDKNLEKS